MRWAATAEEHLPAATAREPDFAAYLDTLRRQPPEEFALADVLSTD